MIADDVKEELKKEMEEAFYEVCIAAAFELRGSDIAMECIGGSAPYNSCFQTDLLSGGDMLVCPLCQESMFIEGFFQRHRVPGINLLVGKEMIRRATQVLKGHKPSINPTLLRELEALL